jgi:hypothetical protein
MPKPKLTAKLIMFPADWVQRINKARGTMPFSDYVRAAVLNRLCGDIGTNGLSEMPAWGQGRPPKKKARRQTKSPS